VETTAKPVYFATPAEFRHWLEQNHARETELLVGFYKKGSGRPSMTWPESVEEALCYGWIDGVRRSVDDERYTIRFTPRRPTSIWSARNVKTMAALLAAGRVAPSGLAAFEGRDPAKTSLYSFERDTIAFDAEQQREFERNRKAWDFFQAQPPSYRKMTTHWVVSAKKPETRAKRLAQLMADCAAGLRIEALRKRTG
jgi:uncharacterized protein YdeI (YjbR/CyaY-like superfamily)